MRNHFLTLPFQSSFSSPANLRRPQNCNLITDPATPRLDEDNCESLTTIRLRRGPHAPPASRFSPNLATFGEKQEGEKMGGMRLRFLTISPPLPLFCSFKHGRETGFLSSPFFSHQIMQSKGPVNFSLSSLPPHRSLSTLHDGGISGSEIFLALVELIKACKIKLIQGVC